MSYNKLKSLVANVEAIETAMKIQVQGRQATAEEKEILSRYSGFGVERIESEIPTLQKIVCRQWSKTDELSRLKQECKELQHRIDESLKEAEQPQAAKHEAIAEAA